MVGVEGFLFFEGHAVQTRYHFEHAADGFIHRQVRTDIFLRNAVARLTQFLAVKTHVPRFEISTALLSGKGLQFGKFTFSLRLGFDRQIVEERQHLIRRLRHFGGQRIMRVRLKTQQLRQLVTQLQNFVHVGAVVVRGIGTQFGRAGNISAIHFFAQGAVFAVSEHRHIRREIQRDAVALLPFSAGLLRQ